MNTGNPENADQTKMVIPIRVHLAGSWPFLETVFGQSGVDLSLLMMEQLRSLFKTEGVYQVRNPHSGVMTNVPGAIGVYQSSMPEHPGPYPSAEEADVLLHEHLQLVADDITAVLPYLSASNSGTLYHYPNGPFVIVYCPVDTSTLDPNTRSKAIPAQAVCYLNN